MKYQAVIFDLDGTILATLQDLANSVNYALADSGLPLRTIEEVRIFVGNGIRLLIERAVPENTDIEIIDRVFETFKAHYKIHSADNTKAYDGVYELLDALKGKGIKLAVLSNKADFAVQDLCKQYFDGYFDVCAGEKAGVLKKPAPDGVYLTAEQMGVALEKCVYVGDSEVDVITARNAKVDCVMVDWGFRDREVLIENGAEIIVSNTDDLLKEIIG